MKNLIIKIDYITPKDPDEECLGQIIINDKEEELNEIFVMSLDSWSIEDYERQWKEGIERLKTHDTSCLVANAQNLKKRPLIKLWTLYKEDKIIYIHNTLIIKGINMPKEWTLKTFSIENCYEFMTPTRKTHAPDGRKFSEWCVDYE